MRVVLTTDTLGGVWTYTRELVTELVRRGVHVTLVSFGNIPDAIQCSWMDGLKGLDFRPTAFKLEWMRDSEEDLIASADYLLRIVHEVEPDLIHLNQFYYGALNCDVPKLVVAHSDVVSWWVAVHGHEPRPDDWTNWYREVVSRGLSGATMVSAPSRWMLDQIILHYGRPASTAVVYNGRNPKLLNPHLTKELAVLSVGRLWDAGKNVALLTKFEPPIPICIVGSEHHPDRGRDTGISAAGWNRIRMKGPQSEHQLRELFAQTAIYAATSRYEPFGLAPLEAALSRCAIIANDIPTFHEIWGDSALYFRWNDAESLHEHMVSLSADSELRTSYANKAYARACQRFISERIVEDYLNLYEILTPAGVLTG
jgi:glycogen(starch) synthase